MPRVQVYLAPMSFIFYFVSLFAQATPVCQVLHVVDATSPRGLARARTELVSLLGDRDSACRITFRPSSAGVSPAQAGDPKFDLVVIQNFPSPGPGDLSTLVGGLQTHLADGARLVVLAREPIADVSDEIAEILRTYQTRNLSMFVWGGPLTEPNFQAIAPVVRIFWDAWAGVSGAAFYAIDGFKPYVVGSLYGVGLYAVIKAADALYTEARRRRVTLPDLRRSLASPLIDSGPATLAVGAGLLLAVFTLGEPSSLYSWGALTSGGAAFLLSRFMSGISVRNQSPESQGPAQSGQNQGSFYAAPADRIVVLRINATDPRLYDCRSELVAESFANAE